MGLGGCSGDGSLAVVAPTDPVVVVSVVDDGDPGTTSVPSSTAAPTQTTAVVERPSTSFGESKRVVGVVVAVDGDLSEVRGFSLLLSDGDILALVPQAGLLFDGGPLAHLRDHLVSGAPVEVEFRIEAGVAIATGVGDAP